MQIDYEHNDLQASIASYNCHAVTTLTNHPPPPPPQTLQPVTLHCTHRHQSNHENINFRYKPPPPPPIRIYKLEQRQKGQGSFMIKSGNYANEDDVIN